MSGPNTILVLGATGGVGGATFKHLVDFGADVIAGTRNPERAQATLGKSVEARRIDFDDPASFEPALEGVDSLFLIGGYSLDMLQQSMAILDAAAAQGVKHVVHLGTSTAPTTRVAHWCWHRYVEAYIEKLGFTFTHLRPEGFMQNLWVYEWLNDGKLISYVRNCIWGWVDCDDIAEVAARTLMKPDVYNGKIIPMAADAMGFEEVAELLSAELGISVEIEYRDPEEFWEGIAASVTDVNVLAYMKCVCNQMKLGQNASIPGADCVYDEYSEIVGRPAVRWKAFIQKHKEQLIKLATSSS